MGAGFADFALIAFHLTRAGVTPPAWIPLLYALAMAVEGAAASAFGRLLDRLGIRVVPVGIMLAALATPLAFLGSAPFAAVGVGLWGIGTAIQDTVFHALLSRHVPSDRRATAYGLFDALRGMAWLVGSVVLGLVYSVSLSALVGISLVLQLGAIPALILHVGRQSGARKALGE
jgi:MFS-type transporter involved in bile tolerance (Atg22 family)